MNHLSVDVIQEVMSFLDATSLTSMASVSRFFFHVVDHDKSWEQAGRSLYENAVYLRSYCSDWRALIRDRNRKNPHMVMNTTLLYEEEEHQRIYTEWRSLPDSFSMTRVRMIIDPYGNQNIDGIADCLSIYLEADTAPSDITLAFTFSLRRPKGRHRSWKSRHHFTSAQNTWGVHNLIHRSEIAPIDSGFVVDGRIHLQLLVHVVQFRLRIMETSEMKKHEGRGLFHMDTKGHQRNVMAGETIRAFRQKHFPLQPHLVFWICDSREGEGIVPIHRIHEQQGDLPMMELLSGCSDQRGEILLWADRFDPSESLLFLKRHVASKRRLVVEGRSTMDNLHRRMRDDSILVLEKTMEEVSIDTLASVDHITVVLILDRNNLEDVRRLYQDHRDRVFRRLEEMLLDSIQHCRLLSMEEILLEGSKIYTDWRIVNMLSRYHNKIMLLRKMIQRPHISYACDRCGKLNFTGIRYKCRECRDYDLCEDCHSLPLMPHRYLFRRDYNYQEIVVRSHSVEHQSDHTLRAIVL